MEIVSLLDKLEGLLPVLIFIIWAVISALGAAGGKNKRRPHGQPQRQAPAPAPAPSDSSGERESESVATTVSDELNRVLEGLFGNKSTEKTTQEKPAPARHQPRGEHSREARTALLNKKSRAQKVNEARGVKKSAPAVDTANSLERPANINRKIKERTAEPSLALMSFSANEAVKGVVWSEILQPPVSMRG